MSKSQPQKSNHNNPSRNNNGNGVATVSSASFSGPMPPPAILEGYEKLIPGAAERILIMAESSMKHQHEYDRDILEASKQQIARGQIFGFLIGLSAIGASVYSATIGYPVLAGILGGTTVVGLVTAFVVGRVAKSKE